MNAYIASFMLLLVNAIGLAVPASAATHESVSSDPKAAVEPVLPLPSEAFDDAVQKWRETVAVKAQSYYPPRAVAENQSGLSIVRFLLSEAGETAQCTVIKSSGSYDLDNQSCRVVLRSVPAPVAADESGNAKSTWVSLPIRWELGDKSEYVEGAP